MVKKPTPQWQPISRLQFIATTIDGMLESAQETHENLLEARPKPWALDDYTIGRVQQVYGQQQDDLWLYEGQLTRWSREPLTEMQGREITRLVAALKTLGQVITDILALAKELEAGTIEKQLAKSDAELGLELLLRGFPKR